VHLNPIELAFSLMMRSGRVSYEDLQKRDPAFVARYEAEKLSADYTDYTD
jgi:hypothetical protein